MSLEYHLYKVVKEQNKPEQAYVFGVERDHVNKTLDLKEVYIFTVIDGVEVKHRIDVTEVMLNMCKTMNGTVRPEIMDRVLADMNKSMAEQQAHEHFSNAMLLAVDAASKTHLSMSDFNTIDEYLAYLARNKS